MIHQETIGWPVAFPSSFSPSKCTPDMSKEFGLFLLLFLMAPLRGPPHPMVSHPITQGMSFLELVVRISHARRHLRGVVWTGRRREELAPVGQAKEGGGVRRREMDKDIKKPGHGKDKEEIVPQPTSMAHSPQKTN